MNKEDLNGLLDNIYELEGLIHLALAREDCPESLPSLIARKAESLRERVKDLDNTQSVTQEETYDSGSISGDGEISDGCGIICGDNDSLAASVDIPMIDELDDSAFAAYTMPDSDVPAVTLTGQVGAVSEEDAEVAEETAVSEDGDGELQDPAMDQEKDGFPSEEVVQDPPVVETQIVEPPVVEIPVPTEDKPLKRNVEPRGKLVFTINDRYRFKRDLFCNSDADFNTTLALVASMDSYEEAEDYFLGELQWNPQREEVLDFLEILKNYFK
ncbi:MAG: hypothetical protein K2G52_05270 [Muribaculaceae bacterium]|nr:hypothetical protein [Muribaculaceae bacterium]